MVVGRGEAIHGLQEKGRQHKPRKKSFDRDSRQAKNRRYGVIHMLNEFIEKILVHERDRKGSTQATQEVEIYFNFVGRFVPPALRKAYLEMHRPIRFNKLVLSDKLFEHCAEIEESARNRMELIVPELAKRNGVTEKLKAENQMEWVRQMNACKAQAEAIVKFELIYY